MKFETAKLIDFASFSQGLQVPIQHQFTEYADDRKRFIRIVDITSGGNEPPRYIVDPGERYFVNESDLFMIRYGSPQVAKGWEGVIANNLFKIKLNSNNLDTNWLYYYLKQDWVNQYLLGISVSATMPAISFKAFGALKVIHPPLPTQRKIASILSAYDDFIENNLKRIKLLEEAIRTQYKILMADNDGSWQKLRIDEAYDFSNGYSFYKDGYSEEGKIVIDLGNISESSNLIMTGKEKYVSELLYDDKKKFHLNKYDVIVAMTDMTSRLGILAKVALIDESNKYILNQRVGRIRSKIDYLDHCFVYASLSNEEFRNEMKAKAKGAVQIYFNTKDILEYEVTIPPRKLIEVFNNVIGPIVDLRFSLNNQNTKLREVRDILLPKLMNGQIEV